VERNLALAQALGFSATVTSIRLRVSQTDTKWAQDFLPPGFRDGCPLLGVHPGSIIGQAEKRWPWKRFVDVAEWFQHEIGGRVIFFGGRDDREVLGQIRESLRTEALIADSLPLSRVLPLIQACSVFLSNDSGLMHLASALNVPLVAVFGPTIPAKNHPWQSPYTILPPGTPLQPLLPIPQD